MSDNPSLLKFTTSELTDVHTEIYQLDNGFIFYFYNDWPEQQRLYVKWLSREIDAELPTGTVCNLETDGNELYFEENDEKKIYKVTFNSPDKINVEFYRDLLKNEVRETGIWWSRVVFGVKYYYRISEDPESDGIVLDTEVTKSMKLKGIHRGRIIFVKYCNTDKPPKAKNVSDNVIVIKLAKPDNPRSGSSTFTRDFTPYIYMVHGQTLLTLDTDTLTFLPTWQLGDEFVFNIICVHNGVIVTMMGHEDDEEPFDMNHVMSAQLSIRYNRPQPPKVEFLSEYKTKFDTLAILGKGTFGCVFMSRNKLDKKKYAVKRIPLRGSRKMDMRNELREVEALSAFKHKGIVGYNHSWVETPPDDWQCWSDENMLKLLNSKEYFDYKDVNSYLYIQMELCQSTLGAWLADLANKDRDIDKMKSWFKQMVSAVACIHANNKIHRDLKPNNILIAAGARLVICDLGIVTERAIESRPEAEMSRTMGMGTPLYRAPEQTGWGGYSAKVDIFSLGLIFAEMCILMTSSEAEGIFNNYRAGIPNDNLSRHMPVVADFVSWLANNDAEKRPDCAEILAHSFLV
ncbi:hypothetical protein PRIPAC_94172 [Pristionchus pacificus]|uniref:Protein kinase domain-containing protein n=1 Tax=Pristionchus pacificus TaxID=54126 RepID=A0A2A6CII8_PRIPA|nr:hypothetical protein PRIPAC_94172 [Pristionchus pacificus]|eukprot:PDM77916.1 protein kinase [Pristionchus pacificus]